MPAAVSIQPRLSDAKFQRHLLGKLPLARLASGSFATFAYGFDQVAAIGNGGNDIANLYGSTGDDTFLGQAQTARYVWKRV